MMNNNDALNIVFKISDKIEYEVDNNIVTVLEKQNHPIQNFFRRFKFRIPLYKNIALDQYSSFVFLQINGENTVEDIGKNLDKAYGEDSHPLYERLLLFLNHIEVNCNYIERIE